VTRRRRVWRFEYWTSLHLWGFRIDIGSLSFYLALEQVFPAVNAFVPLAGWPGHRKKGLMARASNEREREMYAKRRLAELRTVCPDLPDDVLERVNLRQLSFSVRRVAKSCKNTPVPQKETQKTLKENGP
jgi:hypothetical protein